MEMEEGYTLIKSGTDLLFNYFHDQNIWSWKWTLVLGLTFLPWIITFKITHKDKRKQYIISALLIMLIASFLDIVGLSYDLWRYYVTVIPVIGGFFPWNFSVLPALFIITYEIFPKQSIILKGFVVSLMFAYIGEPIADYLTLTLHDPWKHSYSVPVYFAIYLIAYYGGKNLSQAAHHSLNEEDNRTEEKQQNDIHQYAVEHSFDAIYLIEKKHTEKNFRFTEVNSAFCKEMGYSKEEFLTLDPRDISDRNNYNVDIKYQPLLKNGYMTTDTTFVTKNGVKKYVRVNVKAFTRKDKIEVLSIVKFLEDKVSEFDAN